MTLTHNITAKEKEPWAMIAQHFAWSVKTGKSAAQDVPNPDHNAPLQRIAAAWCIHPQQTQTCLTPVFANTSPTAPEALAGRANSFVSTISFSLPEQAVWEAIADWAGITYGPRHRPHPIEAIRRIGTLTLAGEPGWTIVIHAMNAMNAITGPTFERPPPRVDSELYQWLLIPAVVERVNHVKRQLPRFGSVQAINIVQIVKEHPRSSPDEIADRLNLTAPIWRDPIAPTCEALAESKLLTKTKGQFALNRSEWERLAHG